MQHLVKFKNNFFDWLIDAESFVLGKIFAVIHYLEERFGAHRVTKEDLQPRFFYSLHPYEITVAQTTQENHLEALARAGAFVGFKPIKLQPFESVMLPPYFILTCKNNSKNITGAFAFPRPKELEGVPDFMKMKSCDDLKALKDRHQEARRKFFTMGLTEGAEFMIEYGQSFFKKGGISSKGTALALALMIIGGHVSSTSYTIKNGLVIPNLGTTLKVEVKNNIQSVVAL